MPRVRKCDPEKVDRLGFFVIVTSKKMSAQEALDIYRNRDSVEKIFRMLKSGLEYDTFLVHSQSSLEGNTYPNLTKKHRFG